MKHCMINNRFRTHIEDQQCKSALSFLRTLTTRHCPQSPAARRVDESRPCSDRSKLPARRAHSSKPAAAGLLLWARTGTDNSGGTTLGPGGGTGPSKSWLALPPKFSRPPNLAVLLTHCGQLNRKIANLMPTHARFQGSPQKN